MQVIIKLTLSAERERAYLTALRNRFNAPNRGWAWLIRAVLREITAEEENTPACKYPHLPPEMFTHG